jgi:hypothetical protein
MTQRPKGKTKVTAPTKQRWTRRVEGSRAREESRRWVHHGPPKHQGRAAVTARTTVRAEAAGRTIALTEVTPGLMQGPTQPRGRGGRASVRRDDGAGREEVVNLAASESMTVDGCEGVMIIVAEAAVAGVVMEGAAAAAVKEGVVTTERRKGAPLREGHGRRRSPQARRSRSGVRLRCPQWRSCCGVCGQHLVKEEAAAVPSSDGGSQGSARSMASKR